MKLIFQTTKLSHGSQYLSTSLNPLINIIQYSIIKYHIVQQNVKKYTTSSTFQRVIKCFLQKYNNSFTYSLPYTYYKYTYLTKSHYYIYYIYYNLIKQTGKIQILIKFAINNFYLGMNHTQHIPRDHITAAIRSRYPEIHSTKCRCVFDPLAPDIEALKAQNILLRSKMKEGIEKGEKILIEDRLRFMELENQKLHDRILNYQITMQELQKTHMELINMVKIEHKNNVQASSLNNTLRNPGIIKGSNQTNININKIADMVIEQGFEGEYLVSLKKVRPSLQQNASRSPQKQEKHQIASESTRRKPGGKLSYEQNQMKKSGYSSTSPIKIDPEQHSKFSPLRSKQRGDANELQRAHQRIKQLQREVLQKSKYKSNSKGVQNENQLLRLKLKNIQQSIKSYQESIKHYQSETNKLKKIIEDLKSKETTGSVTIRQNSSLKESNDYLKKQFEEIEIELERQKQTSAELRRQLGNEKQRLKQINSNQMIYEKEKLELGALTKELEKQKRTIMILNQELEAKSAQLEGQKNRQKNHNNSDFARQILQIKQALQSINLTDIEHQERRNFIEHRSKQVQLTHEVTVLSSELQRYKQQILLLQKKIATLTSEKEMITSSLQQAQKQNSILLVQIKNLQVSIDRYLQQEPLPSLKITLEQRSEQFSSNQGLSVVKYNIQEIIGKLRSLEQKLEFSTQK